MKIVFIISSVDTGGAELSLLRLLSQLSQRTDLNMTVISLTQPKEEMHHHFKSFANLVIFDLKKSPIRGIIRIINCVRNIRPDVIHSHMVHANIIGFILKLLFPRIKLMCTAHSTNEGLLSLTYILISWVANHCTHISRVGLDHYRSTGRFRTKNSSYIPNMPSNQARSLPLKPSNPRAKTNFFCLGRLNKVKRYHLVVEAANILKKNRSDFNVTIIGDGPERGSLIDLVTSLSLENEVFFLGYRENTFEAVKDLDCLIICSEFEGLPNALVETLQAGKLFITSDVGDCGIIADECVGGIRLSETTPDQISDAMQSAINAVAHNYEYISAQHHQFFEKEFNAEYITQAFLEHYEN